MPRLPLLAAATAASLWALPAIAENHNQMTTLAETLRDAGDYQSFFDAVDQAGMTQMLTDDGPFTVLAPTNDAFADPDIDADDTAALEALLMGHIVDGVLTKDDLRAETEIETLDGATHTVELDEGGDEVRIGDAMVVESDLAATNGTIHAIDTILSGGDGGDAEDDS